MQEYYYGALPMTVELEYVETGVITKNKVGSFSISMIRYPTLLEVSNDFAEDFYRAGVMVGHEVYTREVSPIPPKEQVTLRDLLEKDVDENFYKVDIEKWKYLKGTKKALRNIGRTDQHTTIRKERYRSPTSLIDQAAQC